MWVGDPDAYTPMINIPEFIGVGKVQGATYPARIWGALMEPLSPRCRWRTGRRPRQPARKPVRLYLPGNECLAKFVSGVLPRWTDDHTSTTCRRRPPEGEPHRRRPKLRQPVLKAIPSDTTIPADVLDPKAPVPTVPISRHDRLRLRQASGRRGDQPARTTRRRQPRSTRDNVLDPYAMATACADQSLTGNSNLSVNQ